MRPAVRPRALGSWFALAVIVAAGFVVWRARDDRERVAAERGAAVASSAGAASLRDARDEDARRAVAAPEVVVAGAESMTGSARVAGAPATRLVRVRSSLGLVPLDARVRRGDDVEALEGERHADHLAVQVPTDAEEIATLGHAWRALGPDDTDVALEPIASMVLFGTGLDARVVDYRLGYDHFQSERTDERVRETLGQFARLADGARAFAFDPDLFPQVLEPFEASVRFRSGHTLAVQPDLARARHWRIDLDRLVPPTVERASGFRLRVTVPPDVAASGELETRVITRRAIPEDLAVGWSRPDTGDPTWSAMLSAYGSVDAEPRVQPEPDGWSVAWRALEGHDSHVVAIARDSGCFGFAVLGADELEGELVLQVPVAARIQAMPGPDAPPEWSVTLSLVAHDRDGKLRSIASSTIAVPGDGVERVRRLPTLLDDIGWRRARSFTGPAMPDVVLVDGEAFCEGHPNRGLETQPERVEGSWACSFVLDAAVPDRFAGTLVFADHVPEALRARGRGRLELAAPGGVAVAHVVHAPTSAPDTLRLVLEGIEDEARGARAYYADGEDINAFLELRAFLELPEHVVWNPEGEDAYFLGRHRSGRIDVLERLDFRTLELDVPGPPPDDGFGLRAVWRKGEWRGIAGYPFVDRRTQRLSALVAPPGSTITVVHYEPDPATRTSARRAWIVRDVADE